MSRRRISRSLHAGPNPVFRRPNAGWPSWFLPVSLTLLVLGGYVALTWWPRYRVAHIDVSTSASLSAERVREFVAERLQGSVLGVLPRSSMFVLSTGTVKSAIRARLASTVTLSALTVERSWPDRLTVRVEEAAGAYVLQAADGNLLLDPSGIVVNRVPTDAGGLFPLEDPQALPWAVGDRVLASDALLGLQDLRARLGTIGVEVTGARLLEVSCYPPLPPEDATNTNAGTDDIRNSNRNSTVAVNRTPDPTPLDAGTVNAACDTKALVRHNPDLTLRTAEGWLLTVTVTGDRARQVADLSEVLATRTGAARAQLQSVDVRIPGRAYLR